MDLDKLPKNEEIFNSFVVSKSKIDNANYERIMISVSGGADSDILVDMFSRLGANHKVQYVWFDTGLEYQATKDHLKYLEEKYGIEIEVAKALKPIPISCKEYGQPFLSKKISDYIARLQKHNFKWEDRSFEELYKEYPRCKVALRWWCNKWGEGSKFNIEYNKYLKEFMIANPPKFKISEKCCRGAKKSVAQKFKKINNIQLGVVGVRKAEGGTRSAAYKNCFSSFNDKSDEYRPIFWYKEETKRVYEDHFNVCHSRCYTQYGLKRTGCAGCPFGKDFEYELDVISKYEPKLYKAVTNIFKDSYEYTRKYRAFVKQVENEISDEILKSNKRIKKYKQLKII